MLSALAGHALDVLLGGGGANHATSDPEPRITITRVEHSLRPADHRHVASVEICGCDVTFEVCSRLVSAELANILGLLCTAYVRTLARLTSALGCGEDTAQSARAR
jgi:hypothetical protein